jgi:hypothetical protein
VRFEFDEDSKEWWMIVPSGHKGVRVYRFALPGRKLQTFFDEHVERIPSHEEMQKDAEKQFHN